MRRLILITILFFAAAAAGAWGFSRLRRAAPVVQPIAFNHQRHLKEEITCKDCHTGVEKGPRAGLPSVRACLLCHEEAQGKHPDEPKVREYAEKKAPIPWVVVNRTAGHVYFSHEAHVKYGKMDCNECHGDMKEKTEAVTVSQIDHLDMGRCMACHEEKGVSNDCLKCHK